MRPQARHVRHVAGAFEVVIEQALGLGCDGGVPRKPVFDCMGRERRTRCTGAGRLRGEVANDHDGRPKGRPSRTCSRARSSRRLEERLFTDCLDRFEGRTGRRQGACIDSRVGGLQDEGDVDALAPR